MKLPEEVIDILRCPQCKGELVQAEGAFHCRTCALAYAVAEGVPCFLVDEATPLTSGEDPTEESAEESAEEA